MNIVEYASMATLVRYVFTEPQIMLTTPNATEARATMRTFLDAKTQIVPGSFVRMHDFAHRFISRTDRECGPVVSNWWGQQQRVRRVLIDLGYHVGFWQPDGLPAVYGVANLSMHESKQVCERRLVPEYDAVGIGLMLMPTDYDGPAIRE